MRSKLAVAVVGLLLAGSVGCYHATIDTGLAPSTQVVEKAWAAGWIYGLVPPSTVETRAKCPAGVAKVETELSFLNQLVSGLTAGIFTPMTIKVTCAQGSHASVPSGASEIRLDRSATPADMQQALQAAVARSAATGQPVYVSTQ
jgi:hypothetical protein